MKILVIDCETTGLPKDWNLPSKVVDNWPRIIQFAWELFDESGKKLKGASHLIKPEGWVIPDREYFMKQGHSEPETIKQAKFWTDHGYETGISDFENSHDAGADIQACKECYLEIMLRREYESI